MATYNKVTNHVANTIETITDSKGDKHGINAMTINDVSFDTYFTYNSTIYSTVQSLLEASYDFLDFSYVDSVTNTGTAITFKSAHSRNKNTYTTKTWSAPILRSNYIINKESTYCVSMEKVTSINTMQKFVPRIDLTFTSDGSPVFKLVNATDLYNYIYDNFEYDLRYDTINDDYRNVPIEVGIVRKLNSRCINGSQSDVAGGTKPRTISKTGLNAGYAVIWKHLFIEGGAGDVNFRLLQSNGTSDYIITTKEAVEAGELTSKTLFNLLASLPRARNSSKNKCGSGMTKFNWHTKVAYGIQIRLIDDKNHYITCISSNCIVSDYDVDNQTTDWYLSDSWENLI